MNYQLTKMNKYNNNYNNNNNQKGENNNNSNVNVSTILLGLGLIGGLATWYYYPDLFDLNDEKKKLTAKQLKIKQKAKKFKEKLKKPNELLKICKTTLNNNIILYNDYKRDLNKMGIKLQLVVGEEVRTPFGRGRVIQWREDDSMVEIELIWNALLVTKPLGLSNNIVSGESGVEGSSYYFFRSDGSKVKNKWDSYDIDAELKRLDENDGDEDEEEEQQQKQQQREEENERNENNTKTNYSQQHEEQLKASNLKPAKKILQNLQKLKIKLERLQLKIDSIAIDSMTIGKPPNEKTSALYQTIRKRRKLLINNIENILIELETKVMFSERLVNVLS